MAAQIKKEIAIMKSITHPHVVSIKEVFATSSKIFLVIELVEGGELFEYMNEVHMGEDQARFFFKQLVEGLLFCHRNNVCHRDLKPENLLLDWNGNLKISDFGLSTMYVGTENDDDSRVQMLHTTCGTPNYVAPEILESKGYDGRKADVWSVGVILYVMIAGYLPFEEETIPALFAKIKRARYTIPDFFSPAAKDLVSSILVADPNARLTLENIKKHDWMQGPAIAPSLKNATTATVADSAPAALAPVDEGREVTKVEHCSPTRVRFSKSTTGKESKTAGTESAENVNNRSFRGKGSYRGVSGQKGSGSHGGGGLRARIAQASLERNKEVDKEARRKSISPTLSLSMTGEERKHQHCRERSVPDQEVELPTPPAPQATVAAAEAVAMVPSAQETGILGGRLHVPPAAIEGTHPLSDAAAMVTVEASPPPLSQEATTATASPHPGMPTPCLSFVELRLSNGCAKRSPSCFPPTSASEEGKEEISASLQAHPRLRMIGDASPGPEKASCACVIA